MQHRLFVFLLLKWLARTVSGYALRVCVTADASNARQKHMCKAVMKRLEVVPFRASHVNVHLKRLCTGEYNVELCMESTVGHSLETTIITSSARSAVEAIVREMDAGW